MVNASEVNAILEERIKEQEEKNVEFKLSIHELKEQMAYYDWAIDNYTN